MLAQGLDFPDFSYKFAIWDFPSTLFLLLLFTGVFLYIWGVLSRQTRQQKAKIKDIDESVDKST